MEDLIPILLIVLIIGAATFYIIRSKKRGQKCIGCPYAKTCKSKNTTPISCCSKNNSKRCECHKK